MAVAKSEAGRAATAYFRTARPCLSLVTVLGLGYFAVSCRAGRWGAGVLARCAPVGRGAPWELDLSPGGCLGGGSKRRFGGL